MNRMGLIVTWVLVCIGWASMAWAMQSASYRMEPVVLSSTGGAISSAGFRATVTVGQPGPVGVTSSASYTLLAGFWQRIAGLIAGGDVNGDGRVNILDAVLVLQLLSNFPVDGIRMGADINGDRAIGAPEVVYILQKACSVR